MPWRHLSQAPDRTSGVPSSNERLRNSLRHAGRGEGRDPTWVDVGSGGGFPGVVLGCALVADPTTAQKWSGGVSKIESWRAGQAPIHRPAFLPAFVKAEVP
jgi:hypothetical protein